MRSDGSGDAPREESSPGDSSHGDTTLEAILDDYLAELADGKNPDQERYLAENPELAESLRGVFRTLDFVEASSSAVAPPPLEAGRRIGEFRIVRELARGGMGVVYEAVQTSLDRRVALKILPSGALLSPNALERFHREAATAAQLHHTGIVPVFAVGEEQGVHYYAMQFIEGCSLSDHLKGMRRDGITPDAEYFRRVARWGQRVASALAYAHERDTIHRDIKPSNLLLDGADHVWITDFGLARTSARATITASGDVIGTARYMSPEQAGGGHDQLDERTDIYSLGATLYELLTLTPAFEGDSREEVLNRIARERPTPLRRRAAGVPRDLETIVHKCLEKESPRRYGSAAEVAEDLRRFLAHESILARRPSLLVKAGRYARRHRLRLAAAGVILLLAAIAVTLVVNRRHAEGKRLVDQAFVEIMYERDFQRGTELLDEAKSLGVDSSDLHLQRGLIRLIKNQSAAAIEDFTRALRRDRDSTEARLALAMALTSSGDYHAGRRELEQIPEEEIDSALGWLLHGNALSRTQGSRALESYDRATALRPDFGPAIAARAHYRGYRMLTEGRWDDLDPMLADGQALVVFRPNSSRSFAMRGHAWLVAAAYAARPDGPAEQREEWLERSRADFERAVSLCREDDPLAHVEQGTYFRVVEDFAAAEACFARALVADRLSSEGQDHTIVQKHVAMQWANGRLDEALGEAALTVERSPAFYPVALEQAFLLAERGRLEEAREVCLDIVARQQAHANALLLTAALLELLGYPEDATDAVQTIAGAERGEVTSEDAGNAFATLALACFAQERSEEEVLAECTDRPGTHAEIAFLIGLRRLAAGRREAALDAFRTCRDLGIFRFLEHRFSQVLLHRAANDPAWPRWRKGG